MIQKNDSLAPFSDSTSFIFVSSLPATKVDTHEETKRGIFGDRNERSEIEGGRRTSVSGERKRGRHTDSLLGGGAYILWFHPLGIIFFWSFDLVRSIWSVDLVRSIWSKDCRSIPASPQKEVESIPDSVYSNITIKGKREGSLDVSVVWHHSCYHYLTASHPHGTVRF